MLMTFVFGCLVFSAAAPPPPQTTTRVLNLE
jgi:hypothetical protein